MSWQLERDVSGFMVRRSHDAAERFRSAGFWTEETLGEVASRRVAEAPDATLLIEQGKRITRQEVWDKALRLCSYFDSIDLKPGDVVSFQLPNWNEACIISLAARISGLVINPIPPIYRDSEVGHILSDCGSSLIFIPDKFRRQDYVAMLDRLRVQLPKLKHVVVVRGASSGEDGWEKALTSGPLEKLPDIDPAAVMMAMYTSGTTGRPKAVLHSHQSYGFKVHQMAKAWEISGEDTVFMPSPLTHITGAFWCVDMPWLYEAPALMVDVWSPEDSILLIEQNGCTVTGGATPFLQKLLEFGGTRPDSVKTLRIFFCGGTTVSADLIKEASETFSGCTFFRSYGCTETPTTSMGVYDRAMIEYGAETDGRVNYPTEVKLVLVDGKTPAPDGDEGEILVRGPEQFLGYLHDTEGRDFDEEGYFATGDLARRTDGSFLVITGRKKDIIIRSGENISPKEVEDLLYQHPDITDVAIVAMPNPTTGEIGCAFIVSRLGVVIGLEEITTFLTAIGLARQKFPEHVVQVGELPLNPSGKVRKDILRTRAIALASELKKN